jgi:protein SCO1/2
LLLAAVAATVVLVVVALTQEGRGTQDVSAEAVGGPFRAGQLPDGVRGRPAPRFRLRDARGGWLSTDELHGRPYALTFLYTDCPDVCPLIGQELGRALELLGGQASAVAVTAVSVDPEGDTREAVELWLRRLRLPGNFHYLLGTESELGPVWDAYFAAPQQPGLEESLHTASIWLVDRRGRWRAKFSAGVPVAPKDIAHDLRILLRERAA